MSFAAAFPHVRAQSELAWMDKGWLQCADPGQNLRWCQLLCALTAHALETGVDAAKPLHFPLHGGKHHSNSPWYAISARAELAEQEILRAFANLHEGHEVMQLLGVFEFVLERAPCLDAMRLHMGDAFDNAHERVRNAAHWHVQTTEGHYGVPAMAPPYSFPAHTRMWGWVAKARASFSVARYAEARAEFTKARKFGYVFPRDVATFMRADAGEYSDDPTFGEVGSRPAPLPIPAGICPVQALREEGIVF